MRRSAAWAGLAGSVLAAAACGGSARQAAPAPAPFAYDQTQPLHLEDRGRVNDAAHPLAVRDVSFRSGGDLVRGYLVVPPGRRRLPAAVYLHGSGGDRAQLLAHASWLAARGALTLALTAPSRSASFPAGLTGPEALRHQRAIATRDVIAVRRAFDVLESLPRVDRSRLGFLGWSAGARTGAILAGVERRPRAFVLMSGGATPVSAYAAQAPPDLRPQVVRVLRGVDPLRFIRRARPATLLLQNGRRDEVVPQAALAALAGAAPRGAEVRWYSAGHDLDVGARREQLAWLSRKLAISGPPVRGARTGP